MKNKARKVAYVVEDKGGAQFRYRVENVIQALGKSQKWQAQDYLKSEVDKIDFDEIEILVILRQTAKDNTILKLIRKAHGAGVKVLFDLDDLVFDYRDLKLVTESVQEKNVLYWVGYIWGIRRIARRADGFLVTNEFLAEKLKGSFGKPVKIIRNSLNREQIEASEVYIQNKIRKDKGFTIGYFSGSMTHQKDLNVALPQILNFLEKHDDAILKIVGCMRLEKEAEKMKGQGRIQFLPFVDFRKLQRLMAEVDVNIAPLVINDFTNCKSELKFFEAAAVETTTIASPSYTFSRAIKDGENGFLAQPDEWYDKLEYLYTHSGENKKVAAAAKKYALEYYYGVEFLKEIENAYSAFAK